MAAVAAGVVRPDVQANDLLRAVATLCQGPPNGESVYARSMVALLVDGLRYGARAPVSQGWRKRGFVKTSNGTLEQPISK